jgi:hypothetical protein
MIRCGDPDCKMMHKAEDLPPKKDKTTKKEKQKKVKKS